jgi:aspartate/methionine/tyrosine aminotransferase
LAHIALKHQDRLLQRNLEIIRHNLDILDGFFEQHRDIFRWIRPKAGPIAFPGLLAGGVDDFCAKLIAAKGVLLLPGTCYQPSSSNVRVGFGRQNFEQCLTRLEEYLDQSG